MGALVEALKMQEKIFGCFLTLSTGPEQMRRSVERDDLSCIKCRKRSFAVFVTLITGAEGCDLFCSGQSLLDRKRKGWLR